MLHGIVDFLVLCPVVAPWGLDSLLWVPFQARDSSIEADMHSVLVVRDLQLGESCPERDFSLSRAGHIGFVAEGCVLEELGCRIAVEDCVLEEVGYRIAVEGLLHASFLVQDFGGRLVSLALMLEFGCH
jgi:ferredoxin-like protein FixX